MNRLLVRSFRLLLLLLLAACTLFSLVENQGWQEGEIEELVEAVTTSTTAEPHPTWEEVQEQRLKRMKDVCRKYGLDGAKQDLTCSRSHCTVLTEEAHKLAYCVVPKAACTTVNIRLLEASGFKVKEKFRTAVVHSQANKLLNPLGSMASGGSTNRIQSYINEKDLYLFSFVRHPFTRFVSAYENMVRNQRKISFETFANQVISGARRCTPLRCGLNLHWQPYVARCAFCTLDYQMIGTVETYAEDERRLLQMAGLDGMEGMEEEVVGNPNPNYDGKKSNWTALYMAQLDAETRRKLYEVYKLDFEMFGYSAEEYL